MYSINVGASATLTQGNGKISGQKPSRTEEKSWGKRRTPQGRRGQPGVGGAKGRPVARSINFDLGEVKAPKSGGPASAPVRRGNPYGKGKGQGWGEGGEQFP